jgi:hypothetical protein
MATVSGARGPGRAVRSAVRRTLETRGAALIEYLVLFAGIGLISVALALVLRFCHAAEFIRASNGVMTGAP